MAKTMYLCGGVIGILLSFALFVERVLSAMRTELVEFEAGRIIFALRHGVIPRETLGANQKNLFPSHTFILSSA